MKINPVLPSVANAPDGGRPRTAHSAVKHDATSSDAQVDLSSLSATLQEMGAAAATGPVVDAERVAEIKQAIAEGRFKIDPERIADGVLSSVRQMLARSR